MELSETIASAYKRLVSMEADREVLLANLRHAACAIVGRMPPRSKREAFIVVADGIALLVDHHETRIIDVAKQRTGSEQHE